MESSDERLESRPKSTWLGTFTCIEPYIYTIIYGITKCNLYPLLSKGLWKPWPCLRGRSCAALGHQIPLKGYIHNIILSLPHNEDGKNTFPSQFLCDPHHVSGRLDPFSSLPMLLHTTSLWTRAADKSLSQAGCTQMFGGEDVAHTCVSTPSHPHQQRMSCKRIDN